MPRNIITHADLPSIQESDYPITLGLAGEEEEKPARRRTARVDPYVEKVVKLIPSEVVALYLSLDTICRSANASAAWLRWFIFVFCLIATPIYLWRLARVTKRMQLVISSIAFCSWVFALGGPFALMQWYRPLYGALLLPIFAFVVPLIDPDLLGKTAKRR